MKSYLFNVNDKDYNVEILNVENGYAQVSVNNEVISILIKQGGITAEAPLSTVSVPTSTPASAPAPSAAESKPKPVKPTNLPSDGGRVISKLTAPLPGILFGVKVKVGDRVKTNQPILIIEAMKMENTIVSDCDGVVLSINRAVGEAVLQDDVLVEFGA